MESLYTEELHLPVELVFFTEEKPIMPESTLSEVQTAMLMYHEYTDGTVGAFLHQIKACMPLLLMLPLSKHIYR